MAVATGLLALLCASIVSADASSYRQNAICNNDQLMRWFNPNKGLWEDSQGNTYWWQSANMLTAFNDLAIQDGNAKSVYSYVWDSVYRNAPAYNVNPTRRKRADGSLEKVYRQPSRRVVERRKKMKRDEVGFVNHFYDDEGWWALAWIGALDNTGTKEYRDEAIGIWYDMHDGWGKACGGMPWNKDAQPPAVSIANEIYIYVGAALSNRVGDDQKNIYLDAAKEAWEWFKNSGVINGDNLINDGLNLNDCTVNGPVYSYNQGVILGGLVELFYATNDASYLDSAAAIADAVTRQGSILLNDQGILVDDCDKSSNCSGDGVQFKGVFTRNLKKLLSVRPSDQWKSFLETNAQSIWNNDLIIENGGCMNGVYWSGPYSTADASSQSSALDTLNAALAVTS